MNIVMRQSERMSSHRPGSVPSTTEPTRSVEPVGVFPPERGLGLEDADDPHIRPDLGRPQEARDVAVEEPDDGQPRRGLGRGRLRVTRHEPRGERRAGPRPVATLAGHPS